MAVVEHAANETAGRLAAMMPLSDEEVLARVVAGDTPVFELLMRRHNQRLYRVARSVLRDALEAEDVVQDAYVRAFANLSRFRGQSSVATWLTRIAFHEALRRSRRVRLAGRAAAVFAGGRRMAACEGCGEASGAVNEGARVLERGEMGSTLTSALDALPTGLRAIVALRLVQGLGTRETAACLRMSEANVKVSLHRAKQMLAAELGARWGNTAKGELRGEYAFGAERCDRVVRGVFARIGVVARESLSEGKASSPSSPP